MRFFVTLPKLFGLRPIVDLTGTSSIGRRPSDRASKGFVYVVSGDHRLVKIGITTNPMARIASLRTASPFPIDFAYVAETSGEPIDIEQKAHALLDRHRCEGEWFDVAPEVAVGAVAAAAHALGRDLREVDPANAVPSPVRQPAGSGGHALVALVAVPTTVVALGWFEIAKLGVDWPVAAIANGVALLILASIFRALSRVTG